jgi:hypothetical protein
MREGARIVYDNKRSVVVVPSLDVLEFGVT